ncbi:MAG TPA: hypothetical protein VGF73_05415 [Chthoniobacterales bacterium]
MGDEARHLPRFDHGVVRQKDQQLHRRMIVPEMDDALCDHLLGDEMSAIEAGKIVAAQAGRSGDPIDERIEVLRRHPKVLRQQGVLCIREWITSAYLAQ